MPTFSPSSTLRQADGFTLVELMVVLFIIGLAGTAIVLSVGSGDSSATQAEVLAARIAALRDRSVIESRPFALWVRTSGYGFEERRAGKWEALDRKPFVTTNFDKGMLARLPNGQTVRVAFDSSGLPSGPLDLEIASTSRPLRVRVDQLGAVNVTR